MNAIPKKFNFFTIEYPIYFAIVAVVAVFAFFVIFADSFKSYESNLEILFIPKSERVAVQAELIAKNMSLLPKNLSFYEKMLKDNPRLEDNFAGMEKDAKKKAWGEMISVIVREKSTLITVRANSLNAQETEEFSRQIAYTLFDSYAQYYSVKDDIDLRIVDGPITETRYQWLTLSLLSIFFGLIFSFIIYAAIFNIILGYAKVPTMPRLAFRLPTMPSIKTEDIFQKKNNFEVKFKKSEAPGNLPTAKKDFSRVPSNLPTISEEPVIEIIPPIGEERGEPSKEEYKRRLNQLLKGEL